MRSFADVDADGVGDLDGLRDRLGYLELLGVDALVLAGIDPAAAGLTRFLSEARHAGFRVLAAADVDPARTDPQQALAPWLEHEIDGFHLAPREDPHGALADAVARIPEHVVIGSGEGPWQLDFNIDLPIAGFHAEAVQSAVTRVLAPGGRRPAWAMASRDTERSRNAAALTPVRAMALVQLALPGAVCLRHGEELGLPGNQRITMPWEGEHPPFGFSAAQVDWSTIPPEWAAFTAETQLEDEGSTLSLYRHAMEARAAHPAFRGEEIEWFGAPEGCFAFRRVGSTLICALNTSTAPVPLPPGEVLLSSRPLVDGQLPVGTAAWLV
ncbi:DUF3459 domain-containing protein [Saccharopolyspora sp. CA-218241]|uniref:alpha-amylase family glycosyl hydrolase n=1 Tax=Saccharopolyspora sp. CA-218241 TaxID=3240027 RepID=UPI003D99351A